MGPAGALSWQAASDGKTAPIRSAASMRWMLNGLTRPPLRRSTASDRLRFQRQRAGEHRAAEHGLGDGVLHVVGAKEGGHVLERERVLGAERQQHGVVAGRRLELEVERHAELLAQPEA